VPYLVWLCNGNCGTEANTGKYENERSHLDIYCLYVGICGNNNNYTL
jgi:hypothetical protein